MWLMLVNSVTGENKTARMRIYRALKASGAAALRDGVYVLPKSDAARALFAEQVEEVVALGGSAQIFSFDSEDESQERELAEHFNRDADYGQLLAKLTAFKTGVGRLEEAEARRALATFRRDVATLAAIDFFPGASRHQVEGALTDAEAAVNARFSPDEPHAANGIIPRREKATYRGRTWATRQRLWVDRVASAWLIRRFIDPKANFLWLKNPKDRLKNTLGFDFDGAEFTHIGARVTFEVLVASFGLEKDRALARISAMVHYLDVGGIPVPEAAGFAALMAGARAQQANDDELLHMMGTVLDTLYAAFSEPSN
jgi:hypothetical protein